jgi:hypothetical protein
MVETFRCRVVPIEPGQKLLRCAACERGARSLCWLEHVETELPLTMPLCADCFVDAAKHIEQQAAREIERHV